MKKWANHKLQYLIIVSWDILKMPWKEEWLKCCQMTDVAISIWKLCPSMIYSWSISFNCGFSSNSSSSNMCGWHSSDAEKLPLSWWFTKAEMDARTSRLSKLYSRIYLLWPYFCCISGGLDWIEWARWGQCRCQMSMSQCDWVWNLVSLYNQRPEADVMKKW